MSDYVAKEDVINELSNAEFCTTELPDAAWRECCSILGVCVNKAKLTRVLTHAISGGRLACISLVEAMPSVTTKDILRKEIDALDDEGDHLNSLSEEYADAAKQLYDKANLIEELLDEEDEYDKEEDE